MFGIASLLYDLTFLSDIALNDQIGESEIELFMICAAVGQLVVCCVFCSCFENCQ
jgi:hypothetical protein